MEAGLARLLKPELADADQSADCGYKQEWRKENQHESAARIIGGDGLDREEPQKTE